jgi:DNA-binding PucR family transcriptional regulator
MNLRELFPEAVINDQASMGPGWLTIAVEQQFFHFSPDHLSPRELALLELGQPISERMQDAEDSWYQYLLQKKGQVPLKMETVQLIYVEHAHRLSSDLLELFHELLPNLVKVLQVSSTRTVLVLNQEQGLETVELLQDLLPTVESDFGLKLTIFFGNVWAKLQNDDLRQIFDSENQVFSDFIRYKGDEQIISFAQMILWAFSRNLDMGVIPLRIQQLMDDTKDITDIIGTMWQSQGNLVQTAQKLFMHRNSLQYKLDKFQSLSGLNLKNLDDLAFCHLLTLNS